MNDFEITAGRLAELLLDPLYPVFCFASRKARGLVVSDGRIDLRKGPSAAKLVAHLLSGLMGGNSLVIPLDPIPQCESSVSRNCRKTLHCELTDRQWIHSF